MYGCCFLHGAFKAVSHLLGANRWLSSVSSGTFASDVVFDPQFVLNAFIRHRLYGKQVWRGPQISSACPAAGLCSQVPFILFIRIRAMLLWDCGKLYEGCYLLTLLWFLRQTTEWIWTKATNFGWNPNAPWRWPNLIEVETTIQLSAFWWYIGRGNSASFRSWTNLVRSVWFAHSGFG